ncbi:unnamed protein product, partial [Amoebophrya sp. A25]|eukprot:GSA25T00010217001.1
MSSSSSVPATTKLRLCNLGGDSLPIVDVPSSVTTIAELKEFLLSSREYGGSVFRDVVDGLVADFELIHEKPDEDEDEGDDDGGEREGEDTTKYAGRGRALALEAAAAARNLVQLPLAANTRWPLVKWQTTETSLDAGAGKNDTCVELRYVVREVYEVQGLKEFLGDYIKKELRWLPQNPYLECELVEYESMLDSSDTRTYTVVPPERFYFLPANMYIRAPYDEVLERYEEMHDAETLYDEDRYPTCLSEYKRKEKRLAIALEIVIEQDQLLQGIH